MRIEAILLQRKLPSEAQWARRGSNVNRHDKWTRRDSRAS